MTSDIDQKKLRVAIDWVSKLANGMNPIDGSTLPDNDIVNNVHISRCLFFVSNLLEDIEKKKPSSKKQYELEFQLTYICIKGNTVVGVCWIFGRERKR